MLARPLVLAALVLVVLAGCISPDAPGATRNTPWGGADAPRFALTEIPGSGATSEPSIGVDGKGAIYVSAPQGLPSASKLWKSEDGGATWKDLTDAANPTPLGGGDTSIAIGPDDSAYVTDLWAGSATISSSHDGGRTWFQSPIASEVPYYDREWNAVDNEGRAYFLGRTFTPGAAAWVSRSDDGGRTWIHAGNPWINPEGENQDGPLIVNPKTDELAVVYNCPGPAVCVSISKDQGATWRETIAAKTKGNVGNDFAGLAADRAGNWYVAYAETVEKGTEVKVAMSRDGKSWSAPQTLTPEPGTRVFPWIVAGDEGRVAIAWYDTPVAGDMNDKAQMAGANWDVVIAYGLDAASPAPTYRSAALTPAPVHAGTISTQGLTPDGPDRSLGDFFTLAVDPDGHVHAAFMKSLKGDVALVHARQTQGPSLRAPGSAPPSATPAAPSPAGPIPVTIPTLP